MPFFCSRWMRICVWWYECVEVYRSFSQSYKCRSCERPASQESRDRVSVDHVLSSSLCSLSALQQGGHKHTTASYCSPFFSSSTLRWHDISYSPPGFLSRWQRHLRQRGRGDALRHKMGTRVLKLDRVNVKRKARESATDSNPTIAWAFP